MDRYVAEVVASVKAHPKLFNVQIMEVAEIYDEHIRVDVADCYFLYSTLCAISNM